MPCETCPKVPKTAPVKSPYAAEELDERGWAAYRHYRECKAVGQFPDDDVVRVVAGVISEAHREAERMDDERRFNRLAQALLVRAASGGMVGAIRRGLKRGK